MSSNETGELFEALNESIQLRAVIKVLHKESAADSKAIKRLLNEARAISLVGHPSMVKIYDQGQLPGGAPYIVTEYLQGETLRDRLGRIGGRMEPDKAMSLGRQLALVLAAAHSRQVVHRNLKPGNIMLVADADTPEGERLKLFNFDIVKLIANSNTSLLTQFGASMGTPSYMSPEQCKSARTVTDRSDVYSVGILLYELLSGAPPFSDAEGSVGLMQAHMKHDPPSLASRAPFASPALCQLVHRMLAKSPAERPSAAMVASLLSELIHQPTLSPMPGASLLEPPATASLSATIFKVPAVSSQEASGLRVIWRRRWGRSIVAGSIAAVLSGLLGIVGAIHEGRRSTATPPQTFWTVLSEPAGAEVANGAGVVIGVTPWHQVQPSGSGLVTLTIKKKGYSEDQIVLDRSRDGEVKVTLLRTVERQAITPSSVSTSPPPADSQGPHKSKKKRPGRGKHGRSKS